MKPFYANTTRKEQQEWFTHTPPWDRIASCVMDAILDGITDKVLLEAFVLTSMEHGLVAHYELLGRDNSDPDVIRAQVSQILCVPGNRAMASFVKAMETNDIEAARKAYPLAMNTYEPAIALAKNQIVAYVGIANAYNLVGKRKESHEYAMRGLIELSEMKKAFREINARDKAQLGGPKSAFLPTFIDGLDQMELQLRSLVSAGKPHDHQTTESDLDTKTEEPVKTGPVEALVRQAVNMNWKQVHEIKKDDVSADSFAQAMVSIRFERGNEEAVVWRKDATVTLVRVHAPPTFDSFEEIEHWLAENPENNDDNGVTEEALYLREIEKFIIRMGHFDTLLEAQIDKEFFFASAKYHKAAYLAGESDKVVAALTLEALRRYQIDRALGISWLIGFERDCKKLEFVLSLSDAVARLPKQPTPDTLEMMASIFMVSLEYEKIGKISCPQCEKRKLKQTKKGSLNPRNDLDWPYLSPGGDEHHFLCTSCGHSFPVTFWFTK
jgi:hypothetical protein